ncbi:fimbrial protein [Serratia sp. JSRIV001]|uniref:fimbrial protein n=1 Tax=Serratia TaxID=613 RepID=UPI0035302ED8
MKMQSAFFLMLLPPVVFAGNQWNVTVAGGNMRFQGEIIAEACRVEAGSHNMTVIMGQVSSNRFHAVGEDAGPTPFEINLLDCSTAVSQRVSVAFHGIADGKNPELLSVGEGNGVASGVGVAIFDEKNQLIPVNGPVRSWTTLPNDGPLSVHFVAKYRATGHTVTGGAANAEAWFSLTYE